MKIKLLLLLICVYLVNTVSPQSFRGLSPNDLMVKKGAWYDVRAYNAGVATFSNNAINQAIDSCVANGGGTIYFPPGTYTLNDSIFLQNNLVLKGAGASTIIFGSLSNGPILSATSRIDITISDMTFLGIYGESGIGLRFSGCSNIKIQNCHFTTLLYGLQLLGATNENISVNGCTFEQCTTEIHHDDWSALSVYGSNFTSYTPGSFQVESLLRVRTGDVEVLAGDLSIAGKVVSGDSLVGENLNIDQNILAGGIVSADSAYLTNNLRVQGAVIVQDSITLDTKHVLTTDNIVEIKHPFWFGPDQFPLTQCVFKDTAYNNLTSTSRIYVTAVSVFSGTNDKARLTLNWLPYKTSLFDPPDATQKWAAVCTSTWGGGFGPNRTGDASVIVRIDSADYSNKYIYCTFPNQNVGTFPLAVNDTLVIYNPFEAGWEWSEEPLLSPNSYVQWRYSYLSAGPTFLHSNGYLYMLVNGAKTISGESALQSIGVARVHPDSIFTASAWEYLNSDTALMDTCTAKGRGRGILATSMIKLRDIDAYIVYTMQHDATTAWEVSYFVMTEDLEILEDFGTDIITPKPASYDAGANIGTLSRGLGAPSVIEYGGKYLMLFCNRHCATTTYAALDHWSIWEATSTYARGPFAAGSDSILASHNNESLSYRSAYPDMAIMFLFKGRIYALMSGTSQYRPSGSKANRQFGLIYKDERTASSPWVEDTRSPLWINVMQKYDSYDAYPGIFGTGTGTGNNYWFASDHSGGYPTFFSNVNDGFAYIFFACNSGADDYRVWGMRLNSEDW
jgi:hypothetical protein